MRLCVEMMAAMPLDQLESAAAGYAEFCEGQKRRRSNRWQRLANEVDRLARFWVPTTYLMLFTLLMNLDLTDTYREHGGEAGGGEDGSAGNADDGSVQVVEMSDVSTSGYVLMSAGWSAVRLSYRTFAPLGVAVVVIVGVLAVGWVATEICMARHERRELQRNVQGSAREEEISRRVSPSAQDRWQAAGAKVDAVNYISRVPDNANEGSDEGGGSSGGEGARQRVEPAMEPARGVIGVADSLEEDHVRDF